MSSKKKKDTKSVALESTKSVTERLTELEATVKSLTEDFGVMTRRHDMSTETFDARTRQLLAWANEITEAAKGEKPEGMQQAEGHLSEEDLKQRGDLVAEAKEGAKAVAEEDNHVASPLLARSETGAGVGVGVVAK